jgi:Ca-activated chloride channel family protein
MIKRINILALITFFSVAAFAQTPTPTPKVDDDVIKVESRLVVVPVSVTDSAGQPVLGLKAEDFRVLEENKGQEIAQVSDAEKVPLEIALLFDVSASTDAMFQFELETASQFLKEVMRPEDHATIYTIGERPMMIQARDSSEKSQISIKNIQSTKEFTAFYDSVNAAGNYLGKAAPQGTRKVIIAISDGEDTNSEGIRRGFSELYQTMSAKIDTLTPNEKRDLYAKKRDEMRAKEQNNSLKILQNADTVFYSINPAGSSYQLNQISMFGQSNLQRFAEETGGTAFLPKFAPVDLKDKMQNSSNMRRNQEVLSKIFRQLANELQAQYLVQYYSEGDFPLNKYVKLNVGLNKSAGYRVRARQGYFVKN